MADRSDEARDKRAGDILGLGGVTGKEHPVNSLGAEDEEKRRRRMREGIDELTTGTAGNEPPSTGAGATSIDMGSGGDGTDIER